MKWSNDLITEFLELYEKQPSIWNPSDPGHKNRNQVQDSWQNISDHLSVQLPIADLKKKKILLCQPTENWPRELEPAKKLDRAPTKYSNQIGFSTTHNDKFRG